MSSGSHQTWLRRLSLSLACARVCLSACTHNHPPACISRLCKSCQHWVADAMAWHCIQVCSGLRSVQSGAKPSLCIQLCLSPKIQIVTVFCNCKLYQLRTLNNCSISEINPKKNKMFNDKYFDRMYFNFWLMICLNLSSLDLASFHSA